MKAHLFWALALAACTGGAAIVAYQHGSTHQADAVGSLTTANRTAVDEIDELSKARNALQAEVARAKEEGRKLADELTAKLAAQETALHESQAAAQKAKESLIEAQGRLKEAQEALAKLQAAPPVAAAPAPAPAPADAPDPAAELPVIAAQDTAAFEAAWNDLLPVLDAKQKMLRADHEADLARRGSQRVDLHDEGEFSEAYQVNTALAAKLTAMQAAVARYLAKYPTFYPSYFANAKLGITNYQALSDIRVNDALRLRNAIEGAARIVEGARPTSAPAPVKTRIAVPPGN
jgi:hypothetical protein